MTLRNCLFLLLLVLVGCIDNKIQTDKTLSKSDKDYIQSLHLLDKDEKIYKFFSELTNDIAGNFFTEKRLAKYWINKGDKSQDKVDFAYYPDIKSIDTIYHAGATYCPYMLITKIDNSQFKVCVDGSRAEIKSFFEEALNKWQQNKDAK